MSYLLPNYNRLPFTLEKGENVYLYNENGKKYLDMTSGIGVMNLGYSFEAGKSAVKKQLDNLAHLSNLYQNPLQEKVAEKLSQNGEYKAFFCNSGAEANEAALKLARLIKPNQKILTFNNGFHGRTFGAMSATAQAKIQAGFAPLVPDFVSSDFNNVSNLTEILSKQEIGAILVEIVQGEGGVIPMTAAFAAALKNAQASGILLMVDEVQTGIGRTGKLFAFEHFDLQPDIFTVAKALGNGIPTGAMLAKKEFAYYFSAGKHGSTFGGNPLAMAVANEVLSNLTREFLTEVKEKSEFLTKLLTEKILVKSSVKSIHGIGLMQGIQLNDSNKLTEVLEKLRAENLLVLSAGFDVIRLLPPLIIDKSQLRTAVEILEEIL